MTGTANTLRKAINASAQAKTPAEVEEHAKIVATRKSNADQAVKIWNSAKQAVVEIEGQVSAKISEAAARIAAARATESAQG